MEHLFIVNMWFAQALNQYDRRLLFAKFKKPHPYYVSPFSEDASWHSSVSTDRALSPPHGVHSMTVHNACGLALPRFRNILRRFLRLQVVPKSEYPQPLLIGMILYSHHAHCKIKPNNAL